MKRTHKAALLAALLTLPLGLPAAAQPMDELDPEGVTAATRFALPALLTSVVQVCANELDPAGYLLSNSARLHTKFSEGSDEAWPTAKQLVIAMASEDDDSTDAILEAMPDEALKPFVLAVLQGLLTEELKPSQCSDVERGLELLDPMPADNIAGTIGFIIEMVQKEEQAQEAAEAQSDLEEAQQ